MPSSLGMEEKIESNYYPPDWDPKKVPKRFAQQVKAKYTKKSHEDRFAVCNQMQIRTMAPFNIRCNSCGFYTNKGSKIQANVDKWPDPKDPSKDYLYLDKISVWRFHIRCINCRAVIVFRTDPEHQDYDIISGGTRSFRSAYVRARAEEAAEDQQEEIEKNNPMKLLEDRTLASRKELEEVELLEDLQEIRNAPSNTDAGDLLMKKINAEVEDARKTLLAREKEDEHEIISMLKKQKEVELEDEAGDDMDKMKPKMVIRITEDGMKSMDQEEAKLSNSKSSGPLPGSKSSLKDKASLLGIKRKPQLVKPKIIIQKKPKMALVADYSDSDSD